MAKCFCGCGASVPFSMRGANARGKVIAKDLAGLDELLARVPSPTVEAYAEDGRILAQAVAATVHGDLELTPKLEPTTAGWRAAGRHYSAAGLGRAIRAEGLSTDEASARIQSGEWDPFAPDEAD